MIDTADVQALWITFKLALISTFLLMILGTPLAWWLANSKSRFRYLLEALVALPLVLPPTVLGFYLLLILGPRGPIGITLETLGLPSMAFTFQGLVLGSIVYSLPFVVQPIQNAFTAIGDRPLEVAATLRASPKDRFFSIVLPMAKPGFYTASILGFAHTLGEFGVVLMIGGNIPGETKVVSIAIYDHVEGLAYGQAHVLSAILLLSSFVMLVMVFALKQGPHKG